jgi:acyl-coenzyme A thioesterase PaaI-like protein
VPEPTARLFHHDLCFGCGQANLFGLQLEVERSPDGVDGRFFVKQDHQGPPGVAHGGVVTAGLDEAMALALHADGVHARTVRLEVDLVAPAAVGAFVAVAARVDQRAGPELRLSAVASDDGGRTLARAVGTFLRVDLDN